MQPNVSVIDCGIGGITAVTTFRKQTTRHDLVELDHKSAAQSAY